MILTLTLDELFRDGRYTHKMRRPPVRRVRVRAELEGRRIFGLQYNEKLDAIKVSFVEANGHISPARETRAKDTVVTVYDDR